MVSDWTGRRSRCRRTDESFTGSQEVGARAEGCEAKLQCCIDDVWLYAHKIRGLLGTGAQDGHLDFHTALSTVYTASCLRFQARSKDQEEGGGAGPSS